VRDVVIGPLKALSERLGNGPVVGDRTLPLHTSHVLPGSFRKAEAGGKLAKGFW
jgi:hypothetical protein